MFKIFKIRTELIKAQREENLALRNVIFHLKKQIGIMEEIAKIDETEIYRLRDEIEIAKMEHSKPEEA